MRAIISIMAKKKGIEFNVLPSGTELITPLGGGKFIAYKKGNFKTQNVLVEHAPCKRKWYTEKEVELASAAGKAHAAREVRRQAFIENFFYYPL
ncbi:hypothetical protein [Pontibacter harenae]|uniref:hypothetical protein n=1 Tax=Pontibacter harenae TaxID=2894083 RepID=UPI001E5E7D79|nr:hypothetical protein [Pontibacter harenae]MCC9167919.1 hypothetical protein [Pontibacter harenae]